MTQQTAPFQRRSRKKGLFESAVIGMARIVTYAILAIVAAIFLQIAYRGSDILFTSEAPFVNLSFLTEKPSTLYVFEWDNQTLKLDNDAYQTFRALHGEPQGVTTYAHAAGGILPCIIGTLLLVTGSMILALALGIPSAIYLSEYARDGRMIRAARLAILNLAGVPSIVFGLFGMALFVVYLKWNISLLAGWFTLALMALPVVITASEEALKAIPQGFREASLALGATKWQTIRTSVLPYALPGILTSSILALARVAGETAPIMFTAAYVIRDTYPWEVEKWSDFVFQPVMALPYHIYVVSSKIPQNPYTGQVQYGATFVFLLLVISLALTSMFIRSRIRKTLRW